MASVLGPFGMSLNLRFQREIVDSLRSRKHNLEFIPRSAPVYTLEHTADKNVENAAIMQEYNIRNSNFSNEVLSFLPEFPWIITEADIAEREDLRDLDIYTIDQPGCNDIDDALHCRKMANGNYEVGVHIADVSHFIKPGTALDEEAALRAVTVYLVDRQINMIPELLCLYLCSLTSNKDRFAFSCIWELDPDANIVKTRFCKSIIRSRQAMSYEEAQFMIDDHNQENAIALSLRAINQLAKKLKAKRIENGALVLETPEIHYTLDGTTQDPIAISMKKWRDTNSIVEEFMLLANISVAEQILSAFPECALLRRHAEPRPHKFESLIVAARNQGFTINVNSNKELTRSLEEARHDTNPYFNTILRIAATRCTPQAAYLISGMHQSEEFAHYSLGCSTYTHFTSPIRRYADIMVHRLLAASIGADVFHPEILDKEKSNALCHNLNFRNRMAQFARRDSIAFYAQLYFFDKVQDEDGYILFVQRNTLQILIPKYGLEGKLLLNNPNEPFVYNERDQSQTCGDVVLRASDPVVVQMNFDTDQRKQLFFNLVQPVIPGFSVPCRLIYNNLLS